MLLGNASFPVQLTGHVLVIGSVNQMTVQSNRAGRRVATFPDPAAAFKVKWRNRRMVVSWWFEMRESEVDVSFLTAN